MPMPDCASLCRRHHLHFLDSRRHHSGFRYSGFEAPLKEIGSIRFFLRPKSGSSAGGVYCGVHRNPCSAKPNLSPCCESVATYSRRRVVATDPRRRKTAVVNFAVHTCAVGQCGIPSFYELGKNPAGLQFLNKESNIGRGFQK